MTAPTGLPPHLQRFTYALEAAAELVAAQAAEEAARQRTREAKDTLGRAFNRVAVEVGDDPGVLRDLARALYWDHPEITTDLIGRLLSCHASNVHRYVGAKIVLIPCHDCGTEFAYRQLSRTAFGMAWARCPACRTARERQQAADREAYRAEVAARQAEQAEQWERRLEAYEAGDYQRVGEVVTFEDSSEWIIPPGGDLHDARPIPYDPMD
jgi:hypothetical protein